MRFSSLKMHGIQSFPGLCPRTHWGSLRCSRRRPARGEAVVSPSPRIHPSLGLSGLEHCHFGPHTQRTLILFSDAAYVVHCGDGFIKQLVIHNVTHTVLQMSVDLAYNKCNVSHD